VVAVLVRFSSHRHSVAKPSCRNATSAPSPLVSSLQKALRVQDAHLRQNNSGGFFAGGWAAAGRQRSCGCFVVLRLERRCVCVCVCVCVCD
jgi:hypothetical protein